MRRFGTLVTCIVLLGGSANARAQCGAAPRAWVDACASEASLSAVHCREGVWVVEASFDDAPALRVEIRAVADGAFLAVGDFGLSPVVDIPDWGAAPAAWQQNLRELEGCVRERTPFASTSGGVVSGILHAPGSPIPWRLMLGFLALFVLADAERRRLRAMVPKLGPWVLLALVPLALGLRALLVDPYFVHQNGQGPIWVDIALGDPSSYGPGYRAIFGDVAMWAGAAPERGVFLLQSMLGVLVPLSVYLIARLARASAAIALGASLLALLDPVSMRLSASESYFGTIGSLLAVAMMALCLSAGRGRWRLALGVLVAGLLASEAARVHPVAWAAIPLLGLGLVALPPRPSPRRLVEAAAVMASVALVIVITSGADLLAATQQPHVSAYRPGLGNFVGHFGALALMALGLGLISISNGHRPRGLLVAMAIVLPIFVGAAIARSAPWPPLIWHAHLRLFLPPVVVGVAAALVGLRGLPRTRRAAAAVVFAGLALTGALIAPTALTPATDALEQRWALGWRDQLRPDDTLIYLERVERRVLRLPLSDHVAAHPRIFRVADDYDPGVPETGRVFYVETSLCSTPEGAPRCAALRANARWRRLDARTLPARQSDYQPYDVDTIEVWLGERIR